MPWNVGVWGCWVPPALFLFNGSSVYANTLSLHMRSGDLLASAPLGRRELQRPTLGSVASRGAAPQGSAPAPCRAAVLPAAGLVPTDADVGWWRSFALCFGDFCPGEKSPELGRWWEPGSPVALPGHVVVIKSLPG